MAAATDVAPDAVRRAAMLAGDLVAVATALLRDGAAALAHAERALQLYERAHTIASSNHMLWLAGFSSVRLGRLAQRRGIGLLADASLKAARAHYEAWGASALVHHLETSESLTSGSPASPT